MTDGEANSIQTLVQYVMSQMWPATGDSCDPSVRAREAAMYLADRSCRHMLLRNSKRYHVSGADVRSSWSRTPQTLVETIGQEDGGGK